MFQSYTFSVLVGKRWKAPLNWNTFASEAANGE